MNHLMKLCLSLAFAAGLGSMTIGCGPSPMSEEEARQLAGDDDEKEVSDGPPKRGYQSEDE